MIIKGRNCKQSVAKHADEHMNTNRMHSVYKLASSNNLLQKVTDRLNNQIIRSFSYGFTTAHRWTLF